MHSITTALQILDLSCRENQMCFLTGSQIYSRVVQKLLNSSPSLIKEVDNEGKSPLHLACQGGHLMVVQNVLESQQYSEDVLEAGDKMGNTPLHLACVRGERNIVEKLTMKGANPKTTNRDMRTPLHLAAKHNQVDIIEYLLKYVQPENKHAFLTFVIFVSFAFKDSG